MEFKVEDVRLLDGTQVLSVAVFNKGYSRIIIDDHCWVIMNGEKFSAWIFPEAAKILKHLPIRPDDYKPYQDYLRAAA